MKKYPIIHGLDGVYFRIKRNNKWEDICFSDLVEEEQEEIMRDRDKEWLKSLCKILGNTIHKIGEQFNIFSSIDSNDNDD